MKSFVIFAIVVTVIYVIYYTVIIVQDLYGKPKDEKSQGESFDVSDMTDEEESIAVSESDGGFSVGDNQYETAYEEKQLAEPTEEAAATAEESKPHVLEKIQSAIEKKMEEVNTTYSDPMFSEELINTIIARGLHDYAVTMMLYIVYLCYAVAGIVVIVSALQIYIKMNTGEEGVKKNIMMLVGACLFLIGATIVFPAFFGYQI